MTSRADSLTSSAPPDVAPDGREGHAAPGHATGGVALEPRRRSTRVAAGVLVVGLLVTGALAVASLKIYNDNEDRLIGLRVRELGLVLSGALPSVQTPLASAAELADATRGDAQKFRAFMAPYVGPGKQFVSASLWPLGAVPPAPTVVDGVAPLLAARAGQARRFFASAERSSLLGVTGILGLASPRLGYEFNTPGTRNGFAVYAESTLPKDRRSRLASRSGFADLNYALFLGHNRRHQNLLVTNMRHFPITGRQASEPVPFGDSAFTLVVTPNTSLGGAFFERLPWIIAIVGALLSLAAAVLSDRLVLRRRQAEQLAGVLDRVADENRQLYTEQRTIAQTLQHSMLPEKLSDFEGLQAGARYIPATSGIDVGGDWYDIVEVGAGQVLLVVGDVSGHGLSVATTMASLRYAALAYVAQDESPGRLLTKLSDFANSQQHSYFATVLCCLLDLEGHTLTAASAGHPPPLLFDAHDASFVDLIVGVPIGVAREVPYDEVVVDVAPKSTLVAFTDGLVERRGESLDVGLARLRDAATADSLVPDALVAKLAQDLASEDHHDDTAIVAVRWRS